MFDQGSPSSGLIIDSIQSPHKNSLKFFIATLIQDEKNKMDTMAAGLEEESKRSLAMEAELEKHINQFGSERQQLRDKLVTDERRYRDLEDALRKARADVEHFKKQLSEAHRIAMSQQNAPPPYPGAGTSVPPPLSVSPLPPSQSQYANFPLSGYSSGYTAVTTVVSAPVAPVPGVGVRPGVTTSVARQGTSPSGTVVRSRDEKGSLGAIYFNPLVKVIIAPLTTFPIF